MKTDKHYHLIGVGGIGMGTVASLLLDKGFHVSGSDVRENPMIRRLRKKGADIHIGHAAKNIAQTDVVVYSSAIDPENCELLEARQRNIATLKRAQVLSELMKSHTAIAVAGAHGKTTTTSMIGQMLTLAGVQPTSAVGGIVNGAHSHATLGQGEYFVAEVDESDGSFLYFSPDYSIVTNIDLEHLDHYQNWENITKAYSQFFKNTSRDGLIMAFGQDERLIRLLKESGSSFRTFGFSDEDSVQARNIRWEGFQTRFECVIEGVSYGDVILNMPGRHNVANALACICMGYVLSIDFDVIRQSLQNYTGVQRRFQTLGIVNDIQVIDDYAHHPTEILTTLETARAVCDGRVIAVFQPHRYSRLKALWTEFVDSLAGVDQLVITNVYAASESPIEGITAEHFAQDVRKNLTFPVVYLSQKEILDHLLSAVRENDLVITLGAGDVNQIGYDLVKQLQISKNNFSKTIYE